jgi:two-component sensor histidine kinase
MSLFTPNTDFYKSIYDKGKYLLAWRVSLAFLILSILLFGLSISRKSIFNIPWPVYLTLIVSVGLMLSLKKYKAYKIAFWTYIIVITFLVHVALNYFTKTSHYVDLIWMISSILLGFIGLNKKVGVGLVLINVLGLGYFYLYSIDATLLQFNEMSNFEKIGEFIEMVFSLFVVSYLLYIFVNFNVVIKTESRSTYNENTVLVKEIHHRVKNNLQIVISLLRLQQNELKSEEAKQHFSEAINRIMVMSLIHQKLYQDKSLAEIKIKDYLGDLTSDIASLSTLGIPIKVDIVSEIERVGLKTIVPLGLIINELMSNSLEHAFRGKKEALVYVAIEATENNMFELIYFDNGSWNKQTEAYSSFGLELIEILTSQLDGEMKKSISNAGTSFRFTLLNLDHDKNTIGND